MLTLVCGMPEEAQIAQAIFPPSVTVLTGSAKSNLATLVPPGTTRLLSFGLSGGLDPHIPIGGIALATSVTDGSGGLWKPDKGWNIAIEAVAADLAIADPPVWSFQTCPWYSSGLMDQADTAAQRATLLAQTGAWSIDDETNAVVKEAARRNIGFAVLRSCSDDASENLPLAARGQIMNANGGANISYLIQELEKEPFGQTLDLFKVAADFNTSLASLRAAGIALMSALVS